MEETQGWTAFEIPSTPGPHSVYRRPLVVAAALHPLRVVARRSSAALDCQSGASPVSCVDSPRPRVTRASGDDGRRPPEARRRPAHGFADMIVDSAARPSSARARQEEQRVGMWFEPATACISGPPKPVSRLAISLPGGRRGHRRFAQSSSGELLLNDEAARPPASSIGGHSPPATAAAGHAVRPPAPRRAAARGLTRTTGRVPAP